MSAFREAMVFDITAVNQTKFNTIIQSYKQFLKTILYFAIIFSVLKPKS